MKEIFEIYKTDNHIDIPKMTTSDLIAIGACMIKQLVMNTGCTPRDAAIATAHCCEHALSNTVEELG